MSAATHLLQYNVTVAQAREFILSYIQTPEIIYSTSLAYGVTAEMLAEIYGGVSASDVVNFFNSQGLDGNALSDTGTGASDGSGGGTDDGSGGTADAIGADIYNASSMFAGVPVAGMIDHVDDTDWYAVSLSAGTEYTFDLKGTATSAGTLTDPLLELFNSSGHLLGTNDDGGSGNDAKLTYTPSTSGAYYISADAYLSATGSYLLEMQASSNDAGADIHSASSVSVGAPITGMIDYALDADWYAISLTTGTEYTFSLQGNVQYGITTLSDPWLNLYNSSGSYLTFDDDGGSGTDASLVYSPSTSGVYYISANGYSNETGGYILEVQSTLIDIGSDTFSASSISVGGSVSSTIDFGYDSDWFSVVLDAGVTYTFDMQGAATSMGTLSDPLLNLYNSSGSYLTFDDDGGTGTNASLTYTPSSFGAYYIAANGFNDSSGSYSLQVQANTLPSGSFFYDSLDGASDTDTFQVSLVEGYYYQVDIYGVDSGYGTLVDPTVSVSNAEVGFYQSDDDGGIGLDSSLGFVAEYTGANVITVGSFYGDEGSYALYFV